MKKILKAALFGLCSAMVLGGIVNHSSKAKQEEVASADGLSEISYSFGDSGIFFMKQGPNTNRWKVSFMFEASAVSSDFGPRFDKNHGEVSFDTHQHLLDLNMWENHIFVNDKPAEFFHMQKMYFGLRSDGRGEVAVDLKIDKDSLKSITVKAGTQFPTTTFVDGASNEVFVIQKTATFLLRVNDTYYGQADPASGTEAAVKDNKTYFTKELTSVANVGLVDFKCDHNGSGTNDGRHLLHLFTSIEWAKDDIPTGYTEKNNDYTKSLNIWYDYILFDGKPIRTWEQQIGRCFVAKINGFYCFKIDIKIDLTNIKKITILKGAQLPTWATYNGENTTNYDAGSVFTIANTYELEISKNASDNAVINSWKVVDADYVDTNVTDIKLYPQANTTAYSYLTFTLDTYDYTGGLRVCNNKFVHEKAISNMWTNIVVDENTPLSKESTDRWGRVVQNANASGLVVSYNPENAAPFSSITIKAGTLFPASSYTNAAASNGANNAYGAAKFFKTTKDITFYKGVGNWEFVSEEVHEAQAIIEKYEPKVSLSYSYTENDGTYTSDFRLLVGVDSALKAEVATFGGTYGFFVECNTTSKKFSNGVDNITFKDDEVNNITYFVIGLGDILNNPRNAVAEFAINLWLIKGETVDVAGDFKTFTVASLLQDYMALGDQATKDAVSPMYSIFMSLGIYSM